MKYCPNCGTALEDAALFCTACGVQQAPAAPVAPAPVAASVGAKVLGGIGFGLSLFGFLWALFAFIFGCIAMEEAEAGIAAFIYALMLSPFSILGTVFCGNSRKNGNCNGLTACGKVFGIIGIVLFGLGLLMGVTGMSM